MSTDVEIGVAGLSGAVARPGGDGVFPGVVVVHEAIGDQPEIREVCDLFADHGYVAVMPDLFKDGPLVVCIARAMRELTSGTPGRFNGYIDQTRAWLAEQDDVDGERIGVIGFCMGGAFALAYVAGGVPGVRAASANYTEVPKDPAALRGTCPIVSSFGGKDKVMGRRQAEHRAARAEGDAVKAVWRGAVLADSDETIVVEGHHYFPSHSINSQYPQPTGSARSATTSPSGVG